MNKVSAFQTEIKRSGEEPQERSMFEARNIHKVYDQVPSRLHVLRGVDLKIARGEFLAIVGPSGAGKSTLLHILGGLDRPSEGHVIFEGKDIYKMNDRALADFRNAKVGFIFQFYHLLADFSAIENVMLPAMVAERKGDLKAVKLRAELLLEQVGLKDRATHKPNQLSGGEQQRVAIARALINDPDVILCDEPTGNLDSESGRAIVQILLKLNRQYQKSLVVVTHDESIAVQSSRRLLIRDGQWVDDLK